MARALLYSSSRWIRRRWQRSSVGELTTVSTCRARPSLRYCLIRECLKKAFTVTSVSRVTTLVFRDTAQCGPPAGSSGPGEDQFHAVGPADVEVVDDQCLEERRAWRGTSKTMVRETSIWRTDKFPPVARRPVMIGQRQRQRQDAHPALEEHVDGACSEPVADRLQADRVLTGGEPVG